MARKLVAGLLITFTFTSFSIFIIPIKAADTVTILSSTGYIAFTGSFYIVGELQNTGVNSIKYVKITATFYDSSNKVIATDFTYSTLDVIPPNTKSPFTVMLLDKGQAIKTSSYVLSTSYSLSTDFPRGLKILSSSSYVSSIGSLHIVGEVQNTGTAISRFTKVIATLYDESGKVIGCDFTYSDPYDIQPNAKAPFDALYVESNRVALVKSYQLIVQSNQYIDESTPLPPPTTAPTYVPTPTPVPPTATPTTIPTINPTAPPTTTPTINPTTQPTINPTNQPYYPSPTALPTATPYILSPQPTLSPSIPEFATLTVFIILTAVSISALIFYRKSVKERAQ